MGLALDESIDGLEKLESNGIPAYIDPGLVEFLKSYGQIHLDYVNDGLGRVGFMIRVGDSNCADNGGCSSCG